jgi:hypothetical protein
MSEARHPSLMLQIANLETKAQALEDRVNKLADGMSVAWAAFFGAVLSYIGNALGGTLIGAAGMGIGFFVIFNVGQRIYKKLTSGPATTISP